MSSGNAPLKSGELSELIRASGQAIGVELLAMTDSVAGFHPAAGEWCARQIIGHLIEAETRSFTGRIRTILASDTPAVTPWDQNVVAAERRDCERRLPELVKEFQVLRAVGVALVFRLRDAELDRAGNHPELGRMTVREIAYQWAYHDRDHVRQIAENVRAYVRDLRGKAFGYS
ncbi:MAG: DinB family protein [Chloroflexota bacterium]|nr:MAG: DinB family protein [Chloroflexota bacterium]